MTIQRRRCCMLPGFCYILAFEQMLRYSLTYLPPAILNQHSIQYSSIYEFIHGLTKVSPISFVEGIKLTMSNFRPNRAQYFSKIEPNVNRVHTNIYKHANNFRRDSTNMFSCVIAVKLHGHENDGNGFVFPQAEKKPIRFLFLTFLKHI